MKTFLTTAVVFPILVVMAYLTLESMAQTQRIYQECGGSYCEASENAK